MGSCLFDFRTSEALSGGGLEGTAEAKLGVGKGDAGGMLMAARVASEEAEDLRANESLGEEPAIWGTTWGADENDGADLFLAPGGGASLLDLAPGGMGMNCTGWCEGLYTGVDGNVPGEGCMDRKSNTLGECSLACITSGTGDGAVLKECTKSSSCCCCSISWSSHSTYRSSNGLPSSSLVSPPGAYSCPGTNPIDSSPN